MTKKIIALLLLICLAGSVFSACQKKIDEQQAYQIVLEDLGALATKAGTPHIHAGTYDEKPCYNIFITVDGLSLAYVISESGEILHKGPGEHNH